MVEQLADRDLSGRWRSFGQVARRPRSRVTSLPSSDRARISAEVKVLLTLATANGGLRRDRRAGSRRRRGRWSRARSSRRGRGWRPRRRASRLGRGAGRAGRWSAACRALASAVGDAGRRPIETGRGRRSARRRPSDRRDDGGLDRRDRERCGGSREARSAQGGGRQATVHVATHDTPSPPRVPSGDDPESIRRRLCCAPSACSPTARSSGADRSRPPARACSSSSWPRRGRRRRSS